MNEKYEAIFERGPWEPRHHARLPMEKRAAQFASFQALTGYDAAIRESGRLTEAWQDLSVDEADEVNRALAYLVSHLEEKPLVRLSYFEKDPRKEGGAYRIIEGKIDKVWEDRRRLLLEGGGEIAVDQLRKIEIILHGEND